MKINEQSMKKINDSLHNISITLLNIHARLTIVENEYAKQKSHHSIMGGQIEYIEGRIQELEKPMTDLKKMTAVQFSRL